MRALLKRNKQTIFAVFTLKFLMISSVCARTSVGLCALTKLLQGLRMFSISFAIDVGVNI